MTEPERKPRKTSRRALVAAAVLAFVLPPVFYFGGGRSLQDGVSTTVLSPKSAAQRRAQLGGEPASPDVRRVANWVADSRDNGTRSFVILDKAGARVFLFDPQGKLQAAAPAVLGAARGDDTVPGIGDKPLKDVTFEERTTPAGRFIAEVGESSSRGEDVVWVDYDAAVSMHRIIKVPERLEAIATPSPDDNRLSYGCINLPDAFYEQALRPAVDRTGVVVYILPETRPLAKTFASFYDVEAPAKLAQH